MVRFGAHDEDEETDSEITPPKRLKRAPVDDAEAHSELASRSAGTSSTSAEGTFDVPMSDDRIQCTIDLDILECSICMKTLVSPIFQCPAGHVVCGQCHSVFLREQKPCPTCGSVLNNLRNLALERLAESLVVRCRYRQWGCEMSGTLRWREVHERVGCGHRPFACPAGECVFSGVESAVIEHLEKDHSLKRLGEVAPGHTMVLSVHHPAHLHQCMRLIESAGNRLLLLSRRPPTDHASKLHLCMLQFRMTPPPPHPRYTLSLHKQGHGVLSWTAKPRAVSEILDRDAWFEVPDPSGPFNLAIAFHLDEAEPIWERHVGDTVYAMDDERSPHMGAGKTYSFLAPTAATKAHSFL